MRARWIAAAMLSAALCAGCGALKRFAYEGIGRDAWQKPEEVIALLGIRAGDHVADLGAGGGYFTFRLADAVGADGRAYAVDVDDDMIRYLRRRVDERGYANIEVMRAESDRTGLPENAIDLLFTCNTYHHLTDRVRYFEAVLDALEPAGRVAILEYAQGHHATPRDTIVYEMTRAGYRLAAEHDIVEQQSFLVFVPDDE
ncbi:MAG TPA: methyltransferase domain-containing protein [Myxococcota bacterium]